MRLLRITYTAQLQLARDAQLFAARKSFDHAMQNEVDEIHRAPHMDAQPLSMDRSGVMNNRRRIPADQIGAIIVLGVEVTIIVAGKQSGHGHLLNVVALHQQRDNRKMIASP